MNKLLSIFLVLIFVACGCKKAKKGNTVASKNDKLTAKILQQPEAKNIETKESTLEEFIRETSKPPKPAPVVSLEDFFEGNEDLGSIGANLIEHPGINTFYNVLKGIRERDDVQDVLIEISQLDEYLDWPFSEIVYVLTSATQKQVSEWVEPLKSDEIGEGWAAGKPSMAPELKDGYKVYWVWWD